MRKYITILLLVWGVICFILSVGYLCSYDYKNAYTFFGHAALSLLIGRMIIFFDNEYKRLYKEAIEKGERVNGCIIGYKDYSMYNMFGISIIVEVYINDKRVVAVVSTPDRHKSVYPIGAYVTLSMYNSEFFIVQNSVRLSDEENV